MFSSAGFSGSSGDWGVVVSVKLFRGTAAAVADPAVYMPCRFLLHLAAESENDRSAVEMDVTL